MITQSSSATILPFTPPPPAAPKKLSQRERSSMAFRYYDWLLTKNIPSGGFRLLHAIAQCLNEENPFEAFPSTDYLAAYIRRRQSTVWQMLPKLAKLGAIEIVWGSKGSGHPNTFRLPQEFLEFYFGPEKGRLPPIVLAPKKHRQAGISKYRHTGISNAQKIPVCRSENTGLTSIKYRHTGMNHLLATDRATKNGAPSGARAAVVESQSNVTDDDPCPF